MICALLFLAVASDNLTAAQSALADGLPSVAIEKLANAKAPNTESVLLLAEAFFADGQPQRAVDLLAVHPAGPLGEYWKAQSLAALGEWDAALAGYAAAGNAPEVSREALIGQSRMLRQLGRLDEALAALAPALEWPNDALRRLAEEEKAEILLARNEPAEAENLLRSLPKGNPTDEARRDFLLAKAELASGNDAEALRAFDETHALNPQMAIEIATGRARALVRSGKSPIAETLLEDFLSKNFDTPNLNAVFVLLDAIYAAQPSASPSELKRWNDDPDPSLRRTLAGYYLSKLEGRLGRQDRREKLLESVVSVTTNNPIRNTAALELAELRLQHGRTAEAAEILPPAGSSARADFLRALTLAAAKDPSAASALFIAASDDPSLAETALANAALCDLLAGNEKSPGFTLLAEKNPQSPALTKLRLRQAYSLARQDDPAAISLLEELSSLPDISVRANLALAEMKYLRNDRQGALADLQRISTTGGNDPQADALAVFLADNGTSDDLAISTARDFLAAHPDSPAQSEVMMKLGELLFRKGDFAGARVQFESLASKFPGTDHEFPALFLAAQSASHLQTPTSVNDAMLLFEEVAASKSPLALRARFEQAVLQNVLGKPAEAIVILDRILAANPPPDLHAATLIEKGKTLYSRGATDPDFYRQAIQIWQQVAKDPNIAVAFKNQALTRIGSAYENLKDPDAAVAAYYDVIQNAALAPEAFFWFYKAGFASARLLESSKRWEQAINVYEKIAAAGGPRSEEANARINKIRLENFLWDSN